MAYSYSWPVSLPQSPQKGYTESGGVLVLRSPMDSGPAKQRRRGRSPSTMQVSFIMTTQQVADFESFVENTIRGTARYGFPHPRTNQMVEVRIVPQSAGNHYTTTYLVPGYYTVAFQLEVLP
jgi:hypothetical protein